MITTSTTSQILGEEGSHLFFFGLIIRNLFIKIILIVDFMANDMDENLGQK
jgi:hypothetical protein